MSASMILEALGTLAAAAGSLMVIRSCRKFVLKRRRARPVSDPTMISTGMRTRLRPELATERNRGLVDHGVVGSHRDAPVAISRTWEGVIEDFSFPPSESPFDRNGFLRWPFDQRGLSRIEKSDERFHYVGAGTEYGQYPRGHAETTFTVRWDHGVTTEEPASNLWWVMR